MFNPFSFVGGAIWGAIKAPFKWLNDAAVGLFSGGAWGAMAGGILAAVGPLAVPFIQGMVPGLEGVEWLTKLSNYMGSHSFVERLAFLGLSGAGIGAVSGATIGTFGSVADTLSAPAEYVTNPKTKKQERVVGKEDGEKIGMTVGTIATAAAVGVLAVGANKKLGLTDYITGGDDADAPETPTVEDARENAKGGAAKE